MGAIYTVRCDTRDCIEIYNPISHAASQYSLESCRAAARARGWSTVIKGGEVRDYCPQHEASKR